tara:strand:- start:15244 stop:15729 length:486 start_codon:yes stop_codon:yes gene_type:complete
MTLQDIITQLQNIGGSSQDLGQIGGTSSISGIDENQIATAMRNMYGLTADQLPSSMFSAATISSPMLQSTLQKTYSPQIEAKSQTLLSDLMKASSGKNVRQAAGGFAGSGQMQDYMSGAKDVYGKGMSGVLSNIGAQKSQGIQSINDIIKGWQTTAQQIAS